MKKILVIEDKEEVAELLKDILGKFPDCTVYTAYSGHEGTVKAKALHPHLITLDIMLPNKSGLEILEELKKDPATNKIPVIIISAMDFSMKKKVLEAGAAAFFQKPVNIKEFKEYLSSIIEQDKG